MDIVSGYLVPNKITFPYHNSFSVQEKENRGKEKVYYGKIVCRSTAQKINLCRGVVLLPYVGDSLVKEKGKGKTSKTRVKDGRKVKRVRVNLLKK